MIKRIVEYLIAITFNECFKVTKKSVKEMIVMMYLDEITEEVIKEFTKKGFGGFVRRDNEK